MVDSFNENRLNEIRACFNKLKINVSNDWLIDSLKALNALNNNTITGKHLLKRWLNTDLAKIQMNPPFLPLKELKDFNFKTLNGTFVVQIIGIKDVSVPSIFQENDLLNIEDEEEEEGEVDELFKSAKRKPIEKKKNKTKAPRLLSLILSDGLNKIVAIEYSSVPQLSIATPLGCKLLLKGPIQVSFMILLLEESNIEVFGGEVKSLKDSNLEIERGNNKNNQIGNIFKQAAEDISPLESLKQVSNFESEFQSSKNDQKTSKTNQQANIIVIDLTESGTEETLLLST